MSLLRGSMLGMETPIQYGNRPKPGRERPIMVAAPAQGSTPKALVDAIAGQALGNRGAGSMKILVLGGDGYLGWPTALHLSDAGHEVAVVDNFARRGYDNELGVESLVP